MAKLPALTPDEILSSEFEYIADTAFQANEDRARVASFYVVTFGSFLAALITYQFDSLQVRQDWLDWGFAALFFALAVMGVLTILQLGRLRMAWFEAVEAMNAIKEYYIEQIPDLARAIKWRNVSKPDKVKLTSVGFLLTLQVAILGGAALAGSAFFLVRAVAGSNQLFPAFLVGLAFAYGQFELYRWSLR